MKKEKVVICFIGIIVVIIIVLSVLILKMKSDKNSDIPANNEVDTNEQYDIDDADEENNNVQKEVRPNAWSSVDDYLKQFFDNINSNEYLENVTDINKEALVISQCRQIAGTNNILDYFAEEVYTLETDEETFFWTKGSLFNETQRYEIYMKLVVENGKYEIFSIDNDSYKNEINNLSKENYTKVEVLSNDNNTFNMENLIKDEELLNKYFNYFIRCAQTDPEKAYELLDDEYKAERFKSIDDFKKYLSQVANRFEDFQIISYMVNAGEKVSYLVQDAKQNKYLLLYNSVTDFKFRLDDYTIKDVDFSDNYKNASDETKVKTNIAKFMKMINNYDYEKAYNLLDATYRTNNFKTQESYEAFIKQNFYANNYYSIDSIVAQGENYIIQVTSIEEARVASDYKVNTIIMRLGIGTDFKMSISL